MKMKKVSVEKKDKIINSNSSKNFILTLGFLVLVIISLTFVSATYTQSYPALSSSGPANSFNGGPAFSPFDQSMCGAGQDFILQVSPTGCLPSPVRSDLLEDSNAPVYCPIVGTQINPLIDINAINTISVSGQLPPGVQGVGYVPARAALGQPGFVAGQVTQPLLNNMGYAVVVLQQQNNASKIPDSVSGNLTATLRYDIKNAFGVGQAVFYLPEISSEDTWDSNYKQYGFWDGRGYLRAEEIGTDSALVKVYSDRENYGNRKSGDKREVSSVTLQLNKESTPIAMPGFNFCYGSMTLKLNSLESPDSMVRLMVNGDTFELKEKEKFVDNNCQVKQITKRGVVQQVLIGCTGEKTFALTISPKVELQTGSDPSQAYSVGDKLYNENYEKSVYLIYVGTKGRSVSTNELFIVTASVKGTASRLTDDQLNSLSGYVNRRYVSGEITGNLGLDNALNFIKNYAFGATEQFLRGVIEAKDFRILPYGETQDTFGQDLRIVGFADPVDFGISGNNVQANYANSLKDYQTVQKDFSGEKYEIKIPSGTLGEQALREQIELEYKASQMKKTFDLCEELLTKYPNSPAPESCGKIYKLSAPEAPVKSVVENGQTYSISLDGIVEPDFTEFGAEITVKNKLTGKTESFMFTKNLAISLGDNTGEYLRLDDLTEDTASINVNLNAENTKESLKGSTAINNKKLKVGFPDDFGSNYLFTLQKVNLKKLARVSINPKVNLVQTQATFNFKIGIEKRGIQLTPEKTKERITDLNKTIAKIESVNSKLGTFVEAEKKACLAVGTALTVKNFFDNLGGAGIARQKAMHGTNGWVDFCKANSGTGKTYDNVDSCLLKNNDKIETSVKTFSDAMNTQNNLLQALQDKYKTRDGFLGEDVINTDGMLTNYINDTYKNELKAKFNGAQIQTIQIANQPVNVVEIIDLMTSKTVTLSQARDLQLNARLLSSPDRTTSQIALANVKSMLGDIYVNEKAGEERTTFAGNFGNAASTFSSNEKLTPVTVTEFKPWVSVKNSFATPLPNIADDANTYKLKDIATAIQYLLVLDNDHVITETYRISGNTLTKLPATGGANPNPLNLAIKYFDSKTYNNRYQNAEVKYFEQDPYKGLPAIVPFDEQNGWYAAVKSTLPIGGAIRAYDASGRVSSFWLANVGPNGIEENLGGDDIFEQVNLGTGQTYNQFPGITDQSEASRRVTQAVNAIETASRAYKAGVSKVTINGKSYNVGSPAVNLPDIQCQDFMSPSSCNFLFNVCDPVVCPSSRCNLGGAYPVADVVQSGIAGSIFLCMPNFPDIKIPVCLSGIHAGLEGYTSVLQSYQDCLQTSLQTGQNVGICDEVNSVYQCEFFWRQALPIAQYAVPKIVGTLAGQNSRGGGEYLGVQDAWDKAQQSADYFTQYYAANSYKAFKARSAEGVGTEVCKNFISYTSPQGGNLLDAITAPDSPAQFYGKFDTIPYTSVTNPPTSQYKVFYHIYAGKDLPAYYEVYLKGSGSSFFQDTNFRRTVMKGFIAAGAYATNTTDFIAPTGYNQMCIIVNGQEECGFQQVTTEFGVNYITEQYVANQASQTDIKTESECISGTPNIVGLVNPSLIAGQSATGVGARAVDNAINPALYNQGITRICATGNPGQGTDTHIGTETQRWKEVGVCGDAKVKCWLDSQSVKDTIKNTNTEKGVLTETTQDVLNTLKDESGVIVNFDDFVNTVEKISDNVQRIQKINENIDKVFLNNQRGYLTLLRGNAYKAIVLGLISGNDGNGAGNPTVDQTDAALIPEIKVTSSDFESPVFELHNGKIFARNLYYNFSYGKWYWSPDKINWADQDKTPYYQDALSQIDQDFITSLMGKTYGEGINLFMHRTHESSTSLSTDTVILDKDGVFTVHGDTSYLAYGGGGTYTFLTQFKFLGAKNVWQWTPAGAESTDWVNVPKTKVEAGVYKDQSASQRVSTIITALDGMGVSEGAQIIFAISSQIGPSARSCEECGNGLFNLCDKKECTNLGTVIGKQCSFVDGPALFNDCRTKTETVETPTETPVAAPGETGSTASGLKCTNNAECQNVIAKEVIKIAEAKKQAGFDNSVKADTGVKSFECLVLLIANLESSKPSLSSGTRHCKDFQHNGDPLYCDSNQSQVLTGDDGNSLGIMQINTGPNAHPDANPGAYEFAYNVDYGINFLIKNYNQYKNGKKYVCNSETYSGWQAALRGYNGWSLDSSGNPSCYKSDGTTPKGNWKYPEDVRGNSNKNAVIKIYPECGDDFRPST